MEEIEQTALGYLTEPLRCVIQSSTYIIGRRINEIRLRENAPLYITADGRSIRLNEICKKSDISQTASRLCRGSLYSYAENIKEGIITTEYGIRAGVCGRAVIRDGRIDCVSDISSINIRIPHRIKGAADELCRAYNAHGSTLVFSKPGRGKTTMLREIIPILSKPPYSKRLSVIDTRYELSAGIDDYESADILLGYPRADGIRSAIRTMSPEIIICDEISSADDAESVLSAHSSGVDVIATAHAGCVSELMKNKNIKSLIENNVFGAMVGIEEGGGETYVLNDKYGS